MHGFGDGAVRERMIADMPPQFRHVGATLRIEHQMRRALRVGPLGQELAVRAENLDAVALAVAHEDAAVSGAGDAMRQMKLPRGAARRAP